MAALLELLRRLRATAPRLRWRCITATDAWAARVEAWVGAPLALLRGFRDRWLGDLRRRSWYPGVVDAIMRVRNRTAGGVGWSKDRLTTAFG